MKECNVLDPQTCYQLAKTGIWGEAVRQRKPILLNDFQTTHPLKKGYPQGHVSLLKYLTIPIFDNDRIIAVVAVANKEEDYTELDVSQLTLLMDGVWKVVQKRRFEEAVQSSEERFRKAFQLSPDAGFNLENRSGVILLVNKGFERVFGYLRKECARENGPGSRYLERCSIP